MFDTEKQCHIASTVFTIMVLMIAILLGWF
jgi:hypothetical protein